MSIVIKFFFLYILNASNKFIYQYYLTTLPDNYQFFSYRNLSNYCVFVCVFVCICVQNNCSTTTKAPQNKRYKKRQKKKKLINFKEHKQNIYAKNRNKILNTIKQFYTLRIEKRNQKSTSGDKGMSKIY